MMYEVILVFVWILAALNQPQESGQAQVPGMTRQASLAFEHNQIRSSQLAQSLWKSG